MFLILSALLAGNPAMACFEESCPSVIPKFESVADIDTVASQYAAIVFSVEKRTGVGIAKIRGRDGLIYSYLDLEAVDGEIYTIPYFFNSNLRADARALADGEAIDVSRCIRSTVVKSTVDPSDETCRMVTRAPRVRCGIRDKTRIIDRAKATWVGDEQTVLETLTNSLGEEGKTTRSCPTRPSAAKTFR